MQQLLQEGRTHAQSGGLGGGAALCVWESWEPSTECALGGRNCGVRDRKQDHHAEYDQSARNNEGKSVPLSQRRFVTVQRKRKLAKTYKNDCKAS